MELHEPPTASDHGLPLGDGLVGATLWGNGKPLHLSLDRADLWDLRDIEEYHRPEYTWGQVVEAHRAGRHEALKALLEAPYDRAGPTRLSAGRLSLEFPAAATGWRLERATGLATATFADGATLDAFIGPGSIGRLRVRGATPTLEIAPPPFGGPPAGWRAPKGPNLSQHNAWDLGYPPPTPVREAGTAGFSQKGWAGFSFASAVVWKQVGPEWLAAWTIVSGQADPADQWTLAIRKLRAALNTDFDAAHAQQEAWWADYWSRSEVTLPEPQIERLYYSGMYQFGAAARRGHPPAALQGVWTSDDNQLPPWKGDYHHDLNTQMTYWPTYAGNQLEAGLGFLDWLWDTRQTCAEWTHRFYETPGLNVPMTADLANRQIGGWRQYTHSLATGAWLAHHVYLHWRYSQDRKFLSDRAYPYLKAVCQFVEAISEQRDAQGRRHVALSSSPEVGDNRPDAWFGDFSNYDLSLFQWVLGAAAELADALALSRDADHWRQVRAEFPPPATSSAGELQIAPGLAYPGHHRHFSHAVAIHPLGVLTGFDADPQVRRIATATTRQILSASKDLWMGYSYAWSAALAARIGDGKAARDALDIFQRAFVFPNGFHANGDWRGQGIGLARFGAFTLEGSLGAANAIQTMLVQSSPGVLRLFPAIPRSWPSVSFERLLADGAVEVSAALEDGRIARIELASAHGAHLRIAAFDHAGTVDVALAAGRRVRLGPDELRRLNPA